MVRVAYNVKIFLIIFLSIMLLALAGSSLNLLSIAALACFDMTGIRLLWKSASSDERKIERKRLLEMQQENKIKRSVKTNRAA